MKPHRLIGFGLFACFFGGALLAAPVTGQLRVDLPLRGGLQARCRLRTSALTLVLYPRMEANGAFSGTMGIQGRHFCAGPVRRGLLLALLSDPFSLSPARCRPGSSLALVYPAFDFSPTRARAVSLELAGLEVACLEEKQGRTWAISLGYPRQYPDRGSRPVPFYVVYQPWLKPDDQLWRQPAGWQRSVYGYAGFYQTWHYLPFQGIWGVVGSKARFAYLEGAAFCQIAGSAQTGAGEAGSGETGVIEGDLVLYAQTPGFQSVHARQGAGAGVRLRGVLKKGNHAAIRIDVQSRYYYPQYGAAALTEEKLSLSWKAGGEILHFQMKGFCAWARRGRALSQWQAHLEGRVRYEGSAVSLSLRSRLCLPAGHQALSFDPLLRLVLETSPKRPLSGRLVLSWQTGVSLEASLRCEPSPKGGAFTLKTVWNGSRLDGVLSYSRDDRLQAQ